MLTKYSTKIPLTADIFATYILVMGFIIFQLHKILISRKLHSTSLLLSCKKLNFPANLMAPPSLFIIDVKVRFYLTKIWQEAVKIQVK